MSWAADDIERRAELLHRSLDRYAAMPGGDSFLWPEDPAIIREGLESSVKQFIAAARSHLNGMPFGPSPDGERRGTGQFGDRDLWNWLWPRAWPTRPTAPENLLC
ncbi:hypothetical protein [Streptomyces sp. NPDC047525]|uniref:hypothetical protein n=1 Tax=Streptomyces sp. NPDC047525 TaxID=3155264 RepID=UPI0033CBE45C